MLPSSKQQVSVIRLFCNNLKGILTKFTFGPTQQKIMHELEVLLEHLYQYEEQGRGIKSFVKGHDRSGVLNKLYKMLGKQKENMKTIREFLDQLVMYRE